MMQQSWQMALQKMMWYRQQKGPMTKLAIKCYNKTLETNDSELGML